MLLEIVVGVLIVALGLATMVMAIVGLGGMIGAVRIVRCANCRHLVISSGTTVVSSCSSCRHPVLHHPIHALHDVHIVGHAARNDCRAD